MVTNDLDVLQRVGTRKAKGFYLGKEVQDALKKASEISGVSQSRITRKALVEYLNRVFKMKLEGKY